MYLIGHCRSSIICTAFTTGCLQAQLELFMRDTGVLGNDTLHNSHKNTYDWSSPFPIQIRGNRSFWEPVRFGKKTAFRSEGKLLAGAKLRRYLAQVMSLINSWPFASLFRSPY